MSDLHWLFRLTDQLLDAFDRRRSGFPLPYEEEQAIYEATRAELRDAREAREPEPAPADTMMGCPRCHGAGFVPMAAKCACTHEAGDSPCPMHGMDEEPAASPASGAPLHPRCAQAGCDGQGPLHPHGFYSKAGECAKHPSGGCECPPVGASAEAEPSLWNVIQRTHALLCREGWTTEAVVLSASARKAIDEIERLRAASPASGAPTKGDEP